MNAKPASARWQVGMALLVLAIVAVLGGLAVLNPAQDPAGTVGKDRLLGGLWVSPRGNDFEVRGNMLYLGARAYSTNRGNPPVDHVNFTGTWPGDTWHILCSASDPVAGTADLYECHVDLSTPSIPTTGELTTSFDVYDGAGNLNKAPNGLRRGSFGRSLKTCDPIEYIKSRFGLSDPNADNSRDMGAYLQARGFHRVSSPETSAVVIFGTSFPGVSQETGYVAVISSVQSVGDRWQIATVGGGVSSPQRTEHNCTNVSTQSWLPYPKSSTAVSYWVR